MAHFAKIEDGRVTQVIVVGNSDILDADGNESEVVGQQFIAGLGIEGDWKQTSYNTRGGKHPDEKPFRKNYAGIGYSYDTNRDAFISPTPFASWVLNEGTCQWDAPVPMPDMVLGDQKFWEWNEENGNWIEREMDG